VSVFPGVAALAFGLAVATGATTAPSADDGDPAALLREQAPGFRVAVDRDFAPTVARRERAVMLAADLDGDGHADRAFIAVGRGTHRYYLWQSAGSRLRLLTELPGAQIASPWSLKKAGETGLAEMRYSSLLEGYGDTVDAVHDGRAAELDRLRRHYRAAPALELSIRRDGVQSFRAWYFRGGKLASFEAGD